MRWLLVLGVAVYAGAATADDLLAAANAVVPADELVHGSPARANAIAAVADTPGLDDEDRQLLHLALAEAWIDALDAGKAEKEAVALAAEATLPAPLRERVGLVLVAAWQVRVQAAEERLPDLQAAVVGYGPTVRARALAVRARWKLAKKDASALIDLDQALALLADAEPGERVPLYALRLTAMEETGASAEAVRAWLQERRVDPAAAIAAESALSAVQRLAGQPAPPLRLNRIDGTAGEFDLAAAKGRPVLISLFATWNKPSEITAPAVAAAHRRWGGKGLVVIGVSLDSKDTIAGLPAWIARQAVDYPVVGEGLGWDSEVAAAWHVESIPSLILVDAQGLVVTSDIGGATSEEVGRDIDAAVQPLLAPEAVRTHAPGIDDGIP